MQPCITVIAANTIGKFLISLLQVPHENVTVGPGFIFIFLEGINKRMTQMLWLKFLFLEFEALWKKFDCNLS